MISLLVTNTKLFNMSNCHLFMMNKGRVRIYIMGRQYHVPSNLTIMSAMEYAGYKLVRGVGCRNGYCGACATLYRIKGDIELKTALACQKLVEADMIIVLTPFIPTEKPRYDLKELKPLISTVLGYYPEISRCICCNSCTKACPQELNVMDFIQAVLRGDFKRVVELSFDCLECGLCTLRCPAGITHYLVARLVRRVYAKSMVPKDKSLEEYVQKLVKKEFEDDLNKLVKMDIGRLKAVYAKAYPREF